MLYNLVFAQQDCRHCVRSMKTAPTVQRELCEWGLAPGSMCFWRPHTYKMKQLLSSLWIPLDECMVHRWFCIRSIVHIQIPARVCHAKHGHYKCMHVFQKWPCTTVFFWILPRSPSAGTLDGLALWNKEKSVSLSSRRWPLWCHTSIFFKRRLCFQGTACSNSLTWQALGLWVRLLDCDFHPCPCHKNLPPIYPVLPPLHKVMQAQHVRRSDAYRQEKGSSEDTCWLQNRGTSCLIWGKPKNATNFATSLQEGGIASMFAWNMAM
jgi:hypothetical protein